MQQRSGILLLVSGPSGSGKTTLCERIASEGEAYYAISCTTRAPRPGEVNGEDYFFLSVDEFKSRIEQGDFLEHAEVHGNFYGTLKSEVLGYLRKGTDVVMDIDVQGAENVRSCDDAEIQTALVDLFVMPPSEEELRARLTGRGTDSDQIIATRMRNSLEEMTHWNKYSSLLVSADKESDYARFKSLLVAERMRISRLREE